MKTRRSKDLALQTLAFNFAFQALDLDIACQRATIAITAFTKELNALKAELDKQPFWVRWWFSFWPPFLLTNRWS